LFGLFWVPALRSAAAGMTSLVAGLIIGVNIIATHLIKKCPRASVCVRGYFDWLRIPHSNLSTFSTSQPPTFCVNSIFNSTRYAPCSMRFFHLPHSGLSAFPPGRRPYGPYGPEAAFQSFQLPHSSFQNAPFGISMTSRPSRSALSMVARECGRVTSVK
jgi:hypothetical protein